MQEYVKPTQAVKVFPEAVILHKGYEVLVVDRTCSGGCVTLTVEEVDGTTYPLTFELWFQVPVVIESLSR